VLVSMIGAGEGPCAFAITAPRWLGSQISPLLPNKFVGAQLQKERFAGGVMHNQEDCFVPKNLFIFPYK